MSLSRCRAHVLLYWRLDATLRPQVGSTRHESSSSRPCSGQSSPSPRGCVAPPTTSGRTTGTCSPARCATWCSARLKGIQVRVASVTFLSQSSIAYCSCTLVFLNISKLCLITFSWNATRTIILMRGYTRSVLRLRTHTHARTRARARTHARTHT